MQKAQNSAAFPIYLGINDFSHIVYKVGTNVCTHVSCGMDWNAYIMHICVRGVHACVSVYKHVCVCICACMCMVYTYVSTFLYVLIFTQPLLRL